jgi:hypothetical protein
MTRSPGRRWAPGISHLSAVAVAVATMILFMAIIGRAIAMGTTVGFMISVAVMSLVVVAFRPFVGFYGCYVLLLLAPFSDQRIDLPIFRSPLQALALITVATAMARFPLAGRHTYKSRVYLPLAIVVAVFLAESIVGHGAASGTRFYNLVAGMWPLALVVLLVETPRQARNVLVGLMATCVALTILWLPGLLTLSESKSGVLGNQMRTGVKIGYAGNPGAVSLLGAVGSLSVQTLVALALVVPVLLGVGMSARKGRVPALIGYTTISVTIFTATIASAVATLLVGTATVLLLIILRPSPDVYAKSRGVAYALMVVMAITAYGMATVPGHRAFERLTDPKNDLSGEVRIYSLQQGWHAFLEQPWIGQGATDVYSYTPDGSALAGHNTWGVTAYEYGLIALVPFAWLLVAIGDELIRVLRSSRTALDTGISAGVLASFVAAFVTGFLTPTWMEVFQDTILWTFIGLAIVWNNWRASDPDAALVA